MFQHTHFSLANVAGDGSLIAFLFRAYHNLQLAANLAGIISIVDVIESVA